MTNFEILNLYKEGKISLEDAKKQLKKAEETSDSGLFYLQPAWKEAGLDREGSNGQVQVVLFCEKEDNLSLGEYSPIYVWKGENFQRNGSNYILNPNDKNQLVSLLKDLSAKEITLVYMWNNKHNSAICAEFIKDSEVVFLLGKAIMEQGSVKKYHIVMPYNLANPSYQAFGGFAKSLSIENPKVILHTVGIEDNLDLSQIIQDEVFYFNEKETEIKYENGCRFIRQLERIEYTEPLENHFRGKTVFITGGAGGLGLIFAKHLAREGAKQVILTGRSKKPLDSPEFETIRKYGTDVLYYSMDVCKEKDVKELVQKLSQQNIQINGIIHSAGVLRDSYMIKKEVNDFLDVLMPKVEGFRNLYTYFKEQKLDFFVTFSSIVGVLGNAGQADYATGNSYMDNMVQYVSKINQNWKHCVSINWPFWEDGGMKLSKANLTYMANKYGLYPISHKDGKKAFDFCIANSGKQVVVVKGNAKILSAFIPCLKEEKHLEEKVAAAKETLKESSKNVVDTEQLKQHMVALLKNLISEETKMPVERISVQTPIEKYGLDSIMMMDVSNELEEIFGPLKKTLLFEYINIDALSDYFVKEFKETVIEKFMPDGEKESAPVAEMKTETVVDHETDEVFHDDIAIIGVAGRYPMAQDVEELWENLCEGKDCITKVPESRWKVSPDREEWGGFIDDVDKFDPLLFEMSHKEAALVDPAERIFMETVWSAMENAGYTKHRLSSENVGVFVGAMYAHYQFYGVEEYSNEDAKPLNSSLSSIANRISYYFNFQGPSLTVDTMCSSSLTALHFAVKCLRDKECSVAVVGGVNLSLHPYKYFILEENSFTSSDGRCRSFGEGGDGYVPGEGSGAIIIKPLSKALEDRDLIHAVIKGTSINHGGHVGGFTVPNPNMQADVISKALKSANVKPSSIQYIEAHGTGTHLGDPIEISGLEKVFQTKDRMEKCSIGSIKSNIGHLEAAAGIAGITKVLLQMEHKKLVPSIHSDILNREINFDSSPFYVQRQLEDWKAEEIEPGVFRRRAGISSFGAGGSNAHVIMEDYPANIVAGKKQMNIVPLSGRTKKQLEEHIDRILDYIYKMPDQSDQGFSRFCYTLQQGREALSYRIAVVCQDFKQLAGLFESYKRSSYLPEGVYEGNSWDSTLDIDVMGDMSYNSKKSETYYQDKQYGKIAAYWCSGAQIDWGFMYGGEKLTPMPLPNLPFEKASLWLPKQRNSIESYQRVLSGTESIIKDHVIQGEHVIPTAYLIELFASVASVQKDKTICIRNMKLYQPLKVDGTQTQIIVERKEVSRSLISLKLYSYDGKKLYSSCEIQSMDMDSLDGSISEFMDSSQIVGRNGGDCYEFFQKRGYEYGESLRVIESVRLTKERIIAFIDTSGLENRAYEMKPELIDGALQTTMLFAEYETGTDNYIPSSIDEIVINSGKNNHEFKVITQMRKNEQTRIFDLDVYNEQQERCMYIRGLTSINTNAVSSSESRNVVRQSADVKDMKKMLSQIISEELGIPEEEITPQIGFEKIGINSISASSILDRLDGMFENLPRTIFYETSNVNELSAYLMDNYKDVLPPSQNAGEQIYKRDTSQINCKVVEKEQDFQDDIAIIGLAGKYPMADSLEEFYQNLLEGKDCITTIPKERWDLEKYFDENQNAQLKHYSKWGGFLNNIDEFDPLFFNIAPNQAAMLDPQERLFLKTAWECLEDGGYTPDTLKGHKVGVYVGVMWGLYQQYEMEKDGKKQIPQTTFSSIANRVSYSMNFDGPSIAVDTMCSSSITAIHLACEAIKSGEIEEAIAGGVNLSIHPSKYIQLCQGKFLSTDGRCRSFGEGGDGYVPGEGVGAVMLKSLKKAVEDKDNIYAVIKASAINHGGHGNGYTVPNVKKQADILSECIKKAGIRMEDISYVEAHGTGTELGDPIEISSLSKVFTGRKNKCSIGSVKSNIGHLEAAAGIAAVTKVLLQMKYKKLVPSIHSEILNKKIDFNTAPVQVQRSLADWEVSGLNKRIAAVNAFGAGGSNGCLILEEFEMQKQKNPRNQGGEEQILTLSARERSQLEVYRDNLIGYLEKNQTLAEENWNSIIATLQTGRKAFEYRLAIVCRGYEDALKKLRRSKDGAEKESIFWGYASEKEILNNIEQNDGYDASIRICAKNWSKGKYIDWIKKYPSEEAKISLPVYPFLKEHYMAKLPSGLTPFHETETMEKEISYQAKRVIKNTDSVIAEHVMGGRKILPGTYYISFAINALRQNFRELSIGLSELNWEEPFEMKNGEQEKTIYLNWNETSYSFEIFYMENQVKHRLVTGKFKMENQSETVQLDMQDIQYGVRNELPEKIMYQNLIKNGYQYGEHYRRTYQIFYSENEAFANISEENYYDEENVDEVAEVLDACIRTALCINGNLNKDSEPLRIPFYLEDLEFYGKLINAKYVYAYSMENVRESKTQKCNILIADEFGTVIANFTNLVSRVLQIGGTEQQTMLQTNVEVLSKNELVFAEPVRREEPVELKDDALLSNSVVWNCTEKELDFGCLKKVYRELDSMEDNRDELQFMENFIYISTCAEEEEQPDSETILKEVLDLTRILKELDQLEHKNSIRFVYCALYRERLNSCISAIKSFLQSFMLVNHELSFSVVAVEEHTYKNQLRSILRYELEHLKKNRKGVISFEDNGRWVSAFQPIQLIEGDTLLKKNGTYVIAGGCGKLGQTLCRYLSSSYQANIVLAGRSQMNESIGACMQQIQSLGGKAIYAPTDICDLGQVQKFIQIALDSFGTIDGIINMAGSTSGKSILEAEESDVRGVLGCKITGTRNLDFATRNISLDFFMTFSSISCIVGDFGECSYSMANEYMNQYMVRRGQLRKEGKRFGQSISVSWPLFEDGTFALPEDKKNIYFTYSGMGALSNDAFTKVLERCFMQDKEQIMVFYGQKRKIDKILEIKEEVEKMSEYTSDLTDSIPNERKYYQETVKYLKNILSEKTGISANRMKEDEDFERYGIDSIMIMEINKRIEKDFKGISKTLLFEYSNLHDMAEYFVQHHKNDIKEFFGIHEERECPEIVPNAQVLERKPINNFRPRLGQSTSSRCEKMAIIGVAGRYPKADNLDEFWEVLKNGIDCIEEIPGERWSIEKYCSDKKEDGKTYSRWGGFVKDADKFDPLFFQISPYQAEMMDPQERIFLETAWSAIEDAGYTRKKLKKNSVGVFVGAMYAHYQMIAEDETMRGNPLAASSYLSSIANRVSYVMDFNGPSVTVDTACSSALEAIRLGCMNIKNGDCDMALVGGVNLSLHPQKYIFLCQSNFLATDGRCHSYEDGGDGYVPGEGVGAILIKPLEAAKRDHDHIYAVINSIAANHGGRTNGYTVPNPNAQSEVIKKALEKGHINPETISYIEGHGTGTILGDPIEVTGLTKAFQASTMKRNFCALGSAKANIGHLEAAAGIAGVTKILLQMKYKMIPPLAGTNELNPNINFEDTPFYVPRELTKWEHPVVYENGSKVEVPLRAGINAFGAGGANVHIELEEFVDKDFVPEMKSPCAIVLSARNESRLQEYAKRLIEYINNNTLTCVENEIKVDDISEKLKKIVAGCLDISCNDVDDEDDLLELGLDLISMEHMRKQIEETFQEDISKEFTQSQITIRSLASKLGGNSVTNLSSATKPLRLDELAYTLQTGREQMECRIGFMASSLEETADKLIAYLEKKEEPEIFCHMDKEKSMELDLFEDEDGKELLELLIRKNRVEKLLSLWVKGVSIDWDMLYQNNGMKKISLPTYPFERKRYFIKTSEDQNEIVVRNVKKDKEIVEDVDCTYESDWFLDTKYQPVEIEKLDHVVICYHKSAEKLAKTIGSYHRSGKVEYYEFTSDSLLVKSPLKTVDRVYFIGNVEGKETLDYDEKNGLSTLSALFSLLKIAYRGNRPKSICVLSNRAYLIHKGEEVNPYGAGTFGLIHSVEKEYTDIAFSYFDVDVFGESGSYDETYAKALMSIVCGEEKSLTVRAIRNNKVYGREIYRTHLQTAKSVLKDRGVYVIFGGMGSVGQDLIKHLLSNYKASIAIIGKSSLTQERKEILEGFKVLGGTVSYYQGDICKRKDVSAIIKKIENQFGKIDGVFNSTMVFEEKSFSELKKEEFEETIRIKIAGNANILNAMDHKELDFITVFSSVQAFNGNQGRSHYSAACDIADQFIKGMGRKLTVPVKIISWGFWGNHNGAPLQEEYVQELNKNGVIPVEPAYGMKMLENVLGNDKQHVLVFQAKQFVLDLMGVKQEKAEHIYTDILEYDAKNRYEFEPGKTEVINELCSVGALSILQSLGLFTDKTDQYTKESIYQKALMKDKYKQLLDAIIAIGVKAGYIKDSNGILSATRKISNELNKKISQYGQKIENACRNHKELDGYFILLEHCVNEMPLVFQGKKTAEEVLFPDSKMDLVEGVYKNNKMSTYLNQMLAVGITSYIEQKVGSLKEGEKITILEIGAGTGSSSEIVLDYIQKYGDCIRYIYSDLSQAFLLYGRNRFAKRYSFLDFEILDVEKDLTSQGVGESTVDIAFGTNVFHATKSIHNTVSNIRNVMKEKGLFMLNEGTESFDVLTLTFGMLDGWWLFEDKEIRIEHSPLLTSQTWIKVLEECGYGDSLDMGSIICTRAETLEKPPIKALEKPSKETLEKSPIEITESKEQKEITVEVKEDNFIEDEIVEILMVILKLDREDIELDRNIMDYGVDSILAVKIISDINDKCKVSMTPEVFFECATIERLAEFIRNHQK